MTPWELEFDYIETCNCPPNCPCPFTGAPSTDYGGCHLMMAFHVVRGNFGATPLDGLNAVLVAEVPGNMRAGGYRTGVLVDERGDPDQQAAMKAIFGGAAGGVFEGIDALTVEWLGIDAAPIEFSTETRRAAVPGILEVDYAPIDGFGGRTPELEHTRQRIALGGKLKCGRSSVCRFGSFGLEWDNSGGNVFWGRYTHTHESRN